MEKPSSSNSTDVQPRKRRTEEKKKRHPQEGSVDSEKRQLDERKKSSSSDKSAPLPDGVLSCPFPGFEVPPQWSAYTAVRELLRDSLDMVALIDSEVSVTRLELLARLRDFATFFQLQNVTATARVFVCVSNGVINLLATYAVVCAGAVVVLAKPSLSEDQLRTLILESDSTFVLTDVPTAPKMVKATSSIEIRAMFSTGTVAGGFHCLTSFVNKENVEPREFPLASPEKCVLAICYTSGATGAPKPVQFTHGAFVTNCCSTRRYLDWDTSDVVLCTFDIAELPGLLFPIMSVLSGARCVIASRAVGPKDLYATIKRQKVTCLCSTPDAVEVLVRSKKPSDYGASVKRITVSGSRVPRSLNSALFEAFKNLRCLMNLYTVSEAGGLLCVPPTGGASTGTVGVPAPTVRVKVVSIEGEKNLGVNEAGEICFCSPIATPGYYKKPIPEAADSDDGPLWHKTGDVGYYDTQGHLYVIQRVSEMIRCRKAMVAPSQLEDLILEEYAEDVAEVAVFPLGRRDLGEVPAAAIVLHEERSSKAGYELAKKIKDTVAEKMGERMTIYGGVVFLDKIPLTETGKVDKPKLRQAVIFSLPYCADEYCDTARDAS